MPEAPPRMSPAGPAPKGPGYILQKLQQRSVRSVELWAADLAGRPIAVSVPVAGLEAVLDDGLTIPGTLIGDTQTAELVLVPDAHTFALPPQPTGTAPGLAGRILCDIQEVSGQPAQLCARTALKRQLGRANALGYTFYMGATIEHRWLAAIGEARPADAATGAQLARSAAEVLEAVGVAVRSFHGERGADPSHWAFDLDWVDPLTLADALLTHRRVLRDVARAAQRDVTFMPHPWPEAARNRLDLFVSLVEGGTPAFPDALDPGGLSPAARAFGAWLEAEVPALELVMKGTVNSWTQPDPARVMASASGHGEGGATVLVRGADSCANPYLLLALVLGAGLASSRGTAPEEHASASTLIEAARAAETSTLAREVLGSELRQALVTRARDESAAWRRQVTPWEVQRYLGR